MKKHWLPLQLLLCFQSLLAPCQQIMNPELLWKIGRVQGIGISKDGKSVFYNTTFPLAAENRLLTKNYIIPVTGGTPAIARNFENSLINKAISPDGKFSIVIKPVPIKITSGSQRYPALESSNAYIYDDLNYRHWDNWSNGSFKHPFLVKMKDGMADTLSTDLMPGEPFDADNFTWHPDGKSVIYTAKKKFGTANTISTNTDLYQYDLEKGTTTNISEGMLGYDRNPSFNKEGILAWLSMKRDGFESDKQDIFIKKGNTKLNLTGNRDDITVNTFRWSADGQTLFFISPSDGTLHLFSIELAGSTGTIPPIKQLTRGIFDITEIIGQSGDKLIVSREDMNHASEIFSVEISTGAMNQLTHVNDETFSTIDSCRIEKRWVKTTDGKNMLVWVIYPPAFNSSKKYPSLLFCQGGPQVPLTQFYSYRWNFQLMASQGYIVIAPCRRGMPGFGTKWNEAVSKDWGGQVLRDYLSAVDAISLEPYIDKNRRAAVGASFGGYSVFALAGIHQKRFHSFIAHDGVFDFRSMYGSTDEQFFVNWENGGAYWEKNNAVAQRTYSQSPSNFVQNWDTPILIFHGGKDYRIPAEQGFQAFQAAKLRGIKSRLVYFPEENHWVLGPQNALVWQHEFYRWLDETLQ